MRQTADQRDLRKRALKDSLGSVRLEGFDPSRALVSDLESWAAGKFPLLQVRKQMFDRFAQQDAALSMIEGKVPVPVTNSSPDS